ncbi:MAG: hypothetical protein V4451_01700 [Pseudomonadota bacterium]
MNDGLNHSDQSGQPVGELAGANEQGWLRRFFWRYWAGGFRLPVSYWLMGWLLQFVLLFLSVVVGAAVGALVGSAVLALLVMSVLALAVAVWVSTGLWRSATVYMQTSSRVWGTLAKVSAVGSVVQVLVQVGALWSGR